MIVNMGKANNKEEFEKEQKEAEKKAAQQQPNEIKKEKMQIKFKELEVGETFEHAKDYFIKTNEVKVGFEFNYQSLFNCVNIETGFITVLSPDTLVKRINI